MREITGAMDCELDILFLVGDDRYLDGLDMVQTQDDDDAAFERWLSSVSGQEMDRVLTHVLAGPTQASLFRDEVA
jgi:hypothetical protein